MYVKIRRHQHTRVHAHTGPRRQTRAPACHRHHIPRLVRRQAFHTDHHSSPSLCDRPRGGGGRGAARKILGLEPNKLCIISCVKTFDQLTTVVSLPEAEVANCQLSMSTVWLITPGLCRGRVSRHCALSTQTHATDHRPPSHHTVLLWSNREAEASHIRPQTALTPHRVTLEPERPRQATDHRPPSHHTVLLWRQRGRSRGSNSSSSSSRGRRARTETAQREAGG